MEFRRADGRALTIARRPLNNEVILRHIDYSLNLAEGGSVHGQRQGYNPHSLDNKSHYRTCGFGRGGDAPKCTVTPLIGNLTASICLSSCSIALQRQFRRLRVRQIVGVAQWVSGFKLRDQTH